MEIIPLHPADMVQPGRISSSEAPKSSPFGEVLQQAVEAVNQSQQEADAAARDFAVGQAQSLHGTMIALEKADLSLRLLTQVRDKVVDAYQEVMRMQV